MTDSFFWGLCGLWSSGWLFMNLIGWGYGTDRAAEANYLLPPADVYVAFLNLGLSGFCCFASWALYMKSKSQ